MARIGKQEITEPIKVRMTKTKQASPNGFSVEAFYEGTEYVLSPALARSLEGSYVVVGEESKPKEKVVEKPQKKNVGAAPRNKAVSPKENK